MTEPTTFPHRGAWGHAGWCEWQSGAETCSCELDTARAALAATPPALDRETLANTALALLSAARKSNVMLSATEARALSEHLDTKPTRRDAEALMSHLRAIWPKVTGEMYGPHIEAISEILAGPRPTGGEA